MGKYFVIAVAWSKSGVNLEDGDRRVMANCNPPCTASVAPQVTFSMTGCVSTLEQTAVPLFEKTKQSLIIEFESDSLANEWVTTNADKFDFVQVLQGISPTSNSN